MKPPVSARIPELDGLRGLAIGLVLVWHYLVVPLDFNAGPLVLPIKLVLGAAWSGVDLFFVLSGFLIGGILLDNRHTPHYFKAFYVRRICRIVPLYYVWLGVFSLVSAGPLAAQAPLASLLAPAYPLWVYATYTQNVAMALTDAYGAEWLGITWSLAIEEQFYLVLPALVRVLTPRRLLVTAVSLILAAPLSRALLIGVNPAAELPAYVLPLCRADALLLGVLAAYAVRQAKAQHWLHQHRRAMYGLALGFTGIIGGFAIWPRAQAAFVVVGFSCLALLYTCVLLIAVTEVRGPVSGVARLRPLRALGTIAYGVYLLHQAVNGLWHGLALGQTPTLAQPGDAVVTLAALLTTLGLAQLSWRGFEQRLVQWGRRVAYG